MNSTQIKCFLTVAKTLNITSAAKELYLSQQAVSKYMINLENELGTKLLERKSDGLVLTYTGEYYKKLFDHTKSAFLDVKKETEATYELIKRDFRIGYSMWIDPFGKIDKGVSEFRRQCKDTVFHGEQYENNILIDKLHCKELDVAIISEAQLFPDKELKYTPIAREDISLFAPASIAGDSIDSECWGLPYIHTSSWTWSFLEWQRIGRKEAQDLGLNPIQLKRAPNLWSVFSDLQINDGVFVNDNEFGHCRKFDFLKAFSLNRTSYLCCVWHQSNENPLIERFVTTFL